MKLKTNLFEQIIQHFYEDGCDIHCWIDDEDIEDFLSTWGSENEDLKKTDTRTINGKQWNEFLIGGMYGDYEGKFVNEICPTEGCEHLLVDTETEYDKSNEPVIDARFCSSHDCEYRSESLIKCYEANEKYWTDLGNKPPEAKITLAGEDIFQFTERVGLAIDSKAARFKKIDDNYWTNCTICNTEVPAVDFYIGRDSGMANIFFSHNCNGEDTFCPSIAVPFSKEAKKTWGNII